MLLKIVLRYAIVLILTQHKLIKCNLIVNQAQTNFNSTLEEASLITGGEKLITVEENVTVVDKITVNNGDSGREFPSSARYKRNLDKSYHDIDDYDYGILPASASELPECILSRSEFYLSWWVNDDGSLKLPSSNRDGKSPGFADLSLKFQSDEAIFRHISEMRTENPNDVIIFMSIANNELATLPLETLKLVSISLQYLSLANNNFNTLFSEHNKTFQSWSAFPLMNSLKELDLRNCSLMTLDYDLFENLPNLEKLYLSHNLLYKVSPNTFQNLKRLSHLDLSYNALEPVQSYIIDPFAFYLNGLLIDDSIFSNLPSLLFLDLSHTKLRQESLKALAGLRDKVEQLSLCYTDLPLIAPRMFSSTNMKVIDLSGNPGLLPSLSSTWFEGLEDKLEILIFQDSNIKNIGPLRKLKKLRMLDLRNNNINLIQAPNFSNFGDLEILDLSSNHISNWYERVFTKSDRLKIINLRENNINLMTPEMMKDFASIRFLAIGSNSFVCDCSLRDFIDRATLNALRYQCTNNSGRLKRSYNIDDLQDPKYHYDVFLREFHNYVKFVEESYRNIFGRQQAESYDKVFGSNNAKLSNTVDISSANCNGLNENAEMERSIMNFEFLLLDYNENDYHCVKSDGSSKTKVLFVDIDSCGYATTDAPSSIDSTTSGDGYDIGKEDEDQNDESKSPRALLIIYITIGVPLTFLGAIWFWKRRDIRYFCAIFKNTLILSLDKDDKKALVMKNRRKKSNAKDDYIYDVFVSYSDRDREWVLDQLIPNLEKRSEITICLHERDFQVGLGILENIIHSMDQSRCLLLVVSESFLKSNWCSFEMHLAQHRLIETRREQLILVLLQDIPKPKRPRTLTFLMRTKTYIMWPREDKVELRNVFWRRLKKAIVLNNWEPEKAKAKPRHSIV